MFARFKILTILCLFHLTIGEAQILPSAQYTTHDGLPQIQVMDLIQDHHGFLWAATKGGIARFDGSNWEPFELKNKAVISQLAENSLGEIIAISEGDFGQIIKLDGSRIQYSDFSLNKASFYNLVIEKDTLFNIDFVNATLNTYDLRTLSQIGKQKIDLAIDRLSHYSQEYGLILKRKNKETGRHELYDLENRQHLEITNPGSLLFCKTKGQEFIWSIRGNFLDVYGPDDFKKQYEVRIENENAIEVKAFVDHDLFFNIKEKNYRYNSSSKSLEELYQMNPTRNIFLVDKEENLWNSSENGIQIFPKTNFRNFDTKALNDAWVFKAFEGQYIYGNFSAGLKTVEFNPLKIKPLKIDPSNRIYYGNAIRDGALYIAGSSHITKLKNGQIKSINIQKTNTQVLSAYYHEFNDQIYFGGLNNLIELDENDQVNSYADMNELFNKFIVSIDGLDAGRLLCGTYEDLLIFDLKTKQFESLNHLFPNKSLAGSISMVKDYKGNFWLGNKNGLWLYDVSNNSVQHIDEGHIVNPIYSIIQVKEDMLALGTSKEFMILDLKEHYKTEKTILKTFNHRNGYFGQEVAQNSFLLDGETLWIPTATKLVSVDINTLDFTIDSSDIFPHSINDSLMAWGDAIDEIYELPKGENAVEIKFNTVGFNQPKSSLIQYRLSDVDETWSSWTDEKEVSYNDLSSGIYLLRSRLKTSSYGDQDEYPENEFRFKVNLPFYREPNFLNTLSIFLLVLGGILAYLFYTKRNESIEKEKLERQFKLLQVQTLQSQLNPHFLFNVLGTIQSLVLSGDTDNANKYLVAFSKMIRKYLDYNIEAYNSMEGHGEKPKNIRLKDELEVLEIYLSFEKLKLEEGLSYDIKIESEIDETNVYIPPMLLQPIVENAIEHGIIPKEQPGQILIRVDKFEDRIKIEICDDGIGISKSVKLQKEQPRKYKSRGLQLIRDRIKILNSMGDRLEISIQDNPDGGTITTLILDSAKS